MLSSEAKPAQFRRGDADGDGGIALTDAIVTLGALFLGEAPLQCEDAADVNDDGTVDLSDAVAALAYLFQGGDEIPPPGPQVCGPDPSRRQTDSGAGRTPRAAVDSPQYRRSQKSVTSSTMVATRRLRFPRRGS